MRGRPRVGAPEHMQLLFVRSGTRASIRPLRLDDGAAVLRGCLVDDGVVASQAVEPSAVTEAAEQDCGIDDVREDDRHRSLGVERPRKVRSFVLDDLRQLVDRDRQRSPERLEFRLRK